MPAMSRTIKIPFLQRAVDRLAHAYPVDDDDEDNAAPMPESAGSGWHASSYELRTGLEVIEHHEATPVFADATPASHEEIHLQA
jgi:hypothetical protein